MTLLVDVDHPGSQEDMVSNWEPAHSLLGEAVSGAEIAAGPCLLDLAVTCLPLSLDICSILCSVSGPDYALEPFMGKFSFFSLSFSGDPTV